MGWRPAGTGMLNAASNGWLALYNGACRSLRGGRMGPLKRFGLDVLLAANRRIVEAAQTIPILVRYESEEGAVFCYPFADPYWSGSGFASDRYETEIMAFLKQARSMDYALIDCGANFGFWSAAAGRSDMGGHFAVAIEASPVSFAILKRVQAVNAGRFVALNRAVSSEDGAFVEFHHSLSHAGSHVAAAGGEPAARADRIETITIDAILDVHVPPGTPVIVKLDVEGNEIPALEGAKTLAERESLLIYEDHGSDAVSRVTHHLLGNGYTVFWPEPEGGALAFTEVKSADWLGARKTNPYRGYNLFALPPSKRKLWFDFISNHFQVRHAAIAGGDTGNVHEIC